MNRISRTVMVLIIGLLTINSVSLARTFDDKAKSNKPSFFEKVGDKERIYNVSYNEMWKLANNAALRTFENVRPDEDAGKIEMDSGISLSSRGVHIVVTLTKVDAGRTRVTVTTHKKSRLFAWGSGGNLANNFFKAIDKQLTPDPGPEIKKTAE